MADVMTSLIKVFSNGAYALCYLASSEDSQQEAANYTIHRFGTCQDSYMSFITGVLLTLLPLWFRFAQCVHMVYEASPPRAAQTQRVHHEHPLLAWRRWPALAWPASLMVWPHSYNALKYVMGMVVVLFGLMHPLSEDASTTQLAAYKGVFVVVCMCATLFSCYWDVCNDWGLCQIRPSWRDLRAGRLGSKPFLREQLLYKNPNVYYAAICINFILRAVWTLSLIPQGSSSRPFEYSLADQLGPFLSAFELVRRCMWGCLRLEWEHIKVSKAALANAAASSTSTTVTGISLHLNRPKPASQDANKDTKVAVYHLVAGALILGVVFLCVWAASTLVFE
jgi:hypothetical protein